MAFDSPKRPSIFRPSIGILIKQDVNMFLCASMVSKKIVLKSREATPVPGHLIGRYRCTTKRRDQADFTFQRDGVQELSPFQQKIG